MFVEEAAKLPPGGHLVHCPYCSSPSRVEQLVRRSCPPQVPVPSHPADLSARMIYSGSSSDFKHVINFLIKCLVSYYRSKIRTNQLLLLQRNILLYFCTIKAKIINTKRGKIGIDYLSFVILFGSGSRKQFWIQPHSYSKSCQLHDVLNLSCACRVPFLRDKLTI